MITFVQIMKKGVSICLSILLLAATLHFTLATHYCGGQEVAMKVSITGKLADCGKAAGGMDASEKEFPTPGISLTKHCCDDTITFCGIDRCYSAIYSLVPESFQYNFQVLAIPIKLSARSQTNNYLLYINVSPPGALRSTNVDLSNICVFRI